MFWTSDWLDVNNNFYFHVFACYLRLIIICTLSTGVKKQEVGEEEDWSEKRQQEEELQAGKRNTQTGYLIYWIGGKWVSVSGNKQQKKVKQSVIFPCQCCSVPANNLCYCFQLSCLNDGNWKWLEWTSTTPSKSFSSKHRLVKRNL